MNQETDTRIQLLVIEDNPADVQLLRFALDIEKDQLIRKPGELIRVQPQLFTGDGLLINSCSLGDSEEVSRYANHRHCTIKLSDAKNQLVDIQSSGFA